MPLSVKFSIEMHVGLERNEVHTASLDNFSPLTIRLDYESLGRVELLTPLRASLIHSSDRNAWESLDHVDVHTAPSSTLDPITNRLSRDSLECFETLHA